MIEDIEKRLGELQMVYNAIYRRMVELEKRVRRLENRQPMTGSIQGLDGEWTVSAIPSRFVTMAGGEVIAEGPIPESGVLTIGDLLGES